MVMHHESIHVKIVPIFPALRPTFIEQTYRRSKKHVTIATYNNAYSYWISTSSAALSSKRYMYEYSLITSDRGRKSDLPSTMGGPVLHVLPSSLCKK